MPIFRYLCVSEVQNYSEAGPQPADWTPTSPCGNEYDVLYTSQSKVVQEEASEACPLCGGTDKERLVNTGTSHQLKGRGWFKDGYGGSR